MFCWPHNYVSQELRALPSSSRFQLTLDTSGWCTEWCEFTCKRPWKTWVLRLLVSTILAATFIQSVKLEMPQPFSGTRGESLGESPEVLRTRQADFRVPALNPSFWPCRNPGWFGLHPTSPFVSFSGVLDPASAGSWADRGLDDSTPKDLG